MRLIPSLLLLSAAALSSAQAARIAVVIPEQIIRRPAPDPAAETELGRALKAAGHTLVVLSPTDYKRAQETIHTAGNDAQMNADFRQTYNLDYLLLGEAFAEENPNTLPELRSQGMTSFMARLEFHLINVATSEITYTDAAEGSSFGLAALVAGKRALQQVAKKAAPLVINALQ